MLQAIADHLTQNPRQSFSERELARALDLPNDQRLKDAIAAIYLWGYDFDPRGTFSGSIRHVQGAPVLSLEFAYHNTRAAALPASSAAMYKDH